MMGMKQWWPWIAGVVLGVLLLAICGCHKTPVIRYNPDAPLEQK
jgi:hypothetical protein